MHGASIDTFNDSRNSEDFGQPVKIAATVVPKKQLMSHLANKDENGGQSPYENNNEVPILTNQSSN